MSRMVDGDENRLVRNSGCTHVVVSAYTMSSPQARVLKAMGKWTMAGWIGWLFSGKYLIVLLLRGGSLLGVELWDRLADFVGKLALKTCCVCHFASVSSEGRRRKEAEGVRIEDDEGENKQVNVGAGSSAVV